MTEDATGSNDPLDVHSCRSAALFMAETYDLFAACLAGESRCGFDLLQMEFSRIGLNYFRATRVLGSATFACAIFSIRPKFTDGCCTLASLGFPFTLIVKHN